ncbi:MULTISPECIES: hypothetical protein [Staphylococcus]|uniref:Uncharacterized protein n=1 Tax=Staphylococcus hsinchuensis TaxID=3051183 RepID=A0ABZ3EDB2_9STAP|nr:MULTISPECIES: hypothetical protein [unclassified Staphylococcus]
MTQSKKDAIHSQLYDIYDEIKAQLTELNQEKALVINGPDTKLIKRGIEISYLQGQKRATDHIFNLIEQHPDESEFLSSYKSTEQMVKEQLDSNKKYFSNMSEPNDDFEQVISKYYHALGQQFVFEQMNKTN